MQGLKGDAKSQKDRAWRGHSEEESAGSEVGGGLGGQGLDAAGVTVLAEDVSVQRVAALVIPLRQQRATVLQDTDTELSPHVDISLAFRSVTTLTHRQDCSPDKSLWEQPEELGWKQLGNISDIVTVQERTRMCILMYYLL